MIILKREESRGKEQRGRSCFSFLFVSFSRVVGTLVDGGEVCLYSRGMLKKKKTLQWTVLICITLTFHKWKTPKGCHVWLSPISSMSYVMLVFTYTCHNAWLNYLTLLLSVCFSLMSTRLICFFLRCTFYIAWKSIWLSRLAFPCLQYPYTYLDWHGWWMSLSGCK